MKRVQGSKNVALVECINPIRDKWKVRWNVQEQEEGNASYMEEDFDHKPTVSEISALVLSWHNTEIDRRILQDFVWRGIPVWLSMENEFNYKVAYDLTCQLQGANLPMTMKLGEYGDGTPAYFEFTTIEDFTDFYISSVQYVQTTLTEGWDTKDSIDWKAYEIGL